MNGKFWSAGWLKGKQVPKRSRTGLPRRKLRIETLEERSLLSVSPVGPEFQVNTYTTGSQLNPSVAMDSAGDTVAVWQSLQNGSVYGIYAQRYSAAGVAQGSEFQVNTYTTNQQLLPSVAMDSAGDFVVAWRSAGQDGSGYGIFAQRYNASGAVQGSEFQVNTYTTNNQSNPSVAMDAAGDFVVAWQSIGQDGNGYGIYAQRYNAAGLAQGSEFQVNTYTTNRQLAPSVAMDSAGDFVVAWHSFLQDGSSYGIYAQRYSPAGVAQGSEFKVNTYTTDQQKRPRVAMDATGDFVVAWDSQFQDASLYGIFAQRYNAAGVTQGSEFKVNTYTTNSQRSASAAMDSAGDFVVAWHSFLQDGSGYGIYAQRYNAAGIAQGSEFQVNTYTTSFQIFPSVAMDSAGDFSVAWQSVFQDGSAYGIYAQRYSTGTHANFDFNGNAASVTQAGYTSVLPTQLYSVGSGFGWVTSLPVGGFDRGSVPSSFSSLIRDGQYGNAGAGGARTFQADVVNGDYLVSVKMGDVAQALRPDARH